MCELTYLDIEEYCFQCYNISFHSIEQWHSIIWAMDLIWAPHINMYVDQLENLRKNDNKYDFQGKKKKRVELQQFIRACKIQSVNM